MLSDRPGQYDEAVYEAKGIRRLCRIAGGRSARSSMKMHPQIRTANRSSFVDRLGKILFSLVLLAAAGMTAAQPREIISSLAAGVGNEAGSIRNINKVGGLLNCVNCAIATDATLAGHATSAMPGGPFRISVLEKWFGREFGRATTIKDVANAMSDAGDGARGIVFGARDNDIGHVFNVVNQQGTVRFLDGQTGKAANLEGFQSFRLLRTD
jgi:hypothetical protein